MADALGRGRRCGDAARAVALIARRHHPSTTPASPGSYSTGESRAAASSIAVALKMRPVGGAAPARNNVILLGGSISDRAAATVGATAVAGIHRYRADLALLSGFRPRMPKISSTIAKRVSGVCPPAARQ